MSWKNSNVRLTLFVVFFSCFADKNDLLLGLAYATIFQSKSYFHDSSRMAFDNAWYLYMLRNLLNNDKIENPSCKPFLDHCLNSVHGQFNMLLLTHRVTYYKNIYSCWCLPLNPINFDVDIAIITKHEKVVYFHN